MAGCLKSADRLSFLSTGERYATITPMRSATPDGCRHPRVELDMVCLDTVAEDNAIFRHQRGQPQRLPRPDISEHKAYRLSGKSIV